MSFDTLMDLSKSIFIGMFPLNLRYVDRTSVYEDHSFLPIQGKLQGKFESSCDNL